MAKHTLVLSLLLIGSLGSMALGESLLRKSGPWNPGHRRSPIQKASEYSGRILSTEEYASEGEAAGLHLKLATATGELLVDVGPRWYLNENNFNLTNGEPITVIGIAISLGDRKKIVASELRKGDRNIHLPSRSENRGIAEQEARDR